MGFSFLENTSFSFNVFSSLTAAGTFIGTLSADVVKDELEEEDEVSQP